MPVRGPGAGFWDPRGGSELGIHHRGWGFGGGSGRLGMPVRGRGAWFWDSRGGSELGIDHRGWGFGGGSGGLGMRLRGQGAWFRIQEGGQSWEFIREGRGLEVRVGARHACERARSWVLDPRRGVRVGNSPQRVGVRRWEWRAGHACERARSLVSDPRGGSELGIHHRGWAFGGGSRGLGMRLRGQGAWFWIQEEGQSWEFITEGRGLEVGVGGWACV